MEIKTLFNVSVTGVVCNLEGNSIITFRLVFIRGLNLKKVIYIYIYTREPHWKGNRMFLYSLHFNPPELRLKA